MKHLDQLFIRACKSKEPLKRLCSVRRRFFYADDNPYPHLMSVLSDICDRYHVIAVRDLLIDLAPYNRWKYGINESDTHDLACVKILSSKIRLTDVTTFNGLSRPARLRKSA